MASLIFPGKLFGIQHEMHEEGTLWSLKADIRWVSTKDRCTAVIIAKGNIIEGIEAKK